LSAIVYASDGGRSPSPLRWKNFDPDLTSSEGDLVISQDQLYKLDNARFRSDSSLARGTTTGYSFATKQSCRQTLDGAFCSRRPFM
jgi:hypothetical protein